MTNKTIREFLIERGQNPTDFARLELSSEARYRGWYTGHVVDIKRFNDFVVVLKHEFFMEDDWCTYITAYPDQKKSGYHAKHPNLDLKELEGAEWEGEDILVQITSLPYAKGLLCKPFRVTRAAALIKEPGKISRILEEKGKLTRDEAEITAKELHEKYAGRDHLVIEINGGTWKG